MIQKNFLCKDIEAANEAVTQIDMILSDTPHKCALITLYEKGFTARDIEGLAGRIRSLDHPNLQIAGISLTLVAQMMPEGTGIVLNLLITDEADIEVVPVSCTPGGEAEAARILRERLDANFCVRAVELFGSNMALNTTRFIESAMESHEDVVLFGTTTIRNLAQKISVEEGDTVEVAQADPDAGQDEFIVCDRIMYDGFVAVIFAGRDLKICAEYALGWNPIGRKLSLELGRKPLRGETVVNKINGLPAVDIYREYLGVYPDEYLISNICEFPLVVERDGINICLIPLDCGKNGELYFMMTVREDEQLRFTFASHDEVLYASRESLEKMERFSPEALFLVLCGNRINFLKEDAHIEWDEFGKVSPDHALMHGACELFYHKGEGGILNSAHLAIGLREADDVSGVKEHEHPTLESMRHGRTLSLSDRMSTFLGRITNELIDIAAEARDANDAKSIFLSHMSHEIRTPINAILGMDEMIIRASNEADTLEYAESIRSAGNNLLGIVNDILDFSKIEAGRMNIIPVRYELISLIHDLYDIVKLRASDKGLDVKLDIDPDIPSVLYGDETRIRQIITNILTNAVKYTEKGSVTLCMKRLGAGDDDAQRLAFACPGDEHYDSTLRMQVYVEDTGIGIKPEDINRLFKEYERIEERRNRTIEGTGLGLSITTELLELMGSRLDVKSDYGKGSRFGFEIVQGIVEDAPVGDVGSQLKRKSARALGTDFTAESARLLVVDDSSVNLTIVKSLLSKTKIAIDSALSGKEALELVKNNSYDMILLDHIMPDMDGPETLHKMKEMPDNMSKGAPVVCLTANAVTGSREEYMSMGFTDYLSKPINIKALEEALLAHIPDEKIHMIPSADE